MSTPESTNPTNDHVDLAGYLMEMLTPDEKQRADSHLAGCADCRDEIESLQEWSSALRDIPDEMLLDGPPDDADLVLQRTLRQIRAETAGERRRRTGKRLAAAAAAIAVLAGGGLALGRITAPEPVVVTTPTGPVPGSVTLRGDGVQGVTMAAVVSPAAGWVRVSANVKGVRAGERCELIVLGRDGSRAVAAAWLASAKGERDGTQVDGAAIVAPNQVAGVAVANEAGEEYVVLRT